MVADYFVCAVQDVTEHGVVMREMRICEADDDALEYLSVNAPLKDERMADVMSHL